MFWNFLSHLLRQFLPVLDAYLRLAEVAFVVLVLGGQLAHLHLTKLVEVNSRFDHWDRRCRDSVKVLDHLPFPQVFCEEVEILDHLLSIWQEQICYSHVHVAAFKSKPCDERSKLFDLGRQFGLRTPGVRALGLVRREFLRIFIFENLFTHGLKLFHDIISLDFCDVELLVDLIHLIIDVIVKLFIELVLDVLRQIVVEVLRILRLGELRELTEVWRVLKALNVHHVRELEVVWKGHLVEISVAHLAYVQIAKLVDVIISHLVDLADLSGHLSELLGRYHEILASQKLFVHVELLLTIAQCMIDDVLNALIEVFGIGSTLSPHSLLSSVHLLGHIDLLLMLDFVLVLHLELTISHELIRYIYNGGRLLISARRHHIVIWRLVVFIQIFFIIIHIFLVFLRFIARLFVIKWRVLVINIVLLHLWLIAVKRLEWVGLMLNLLFRLVVTQVRWLE